MNVFDSDRYIAELEAERDRITSINLLETAANRELKEYIQKLEAENVLPRKTLGIDSEPVSLEEVNGPIRMRFALLMLRAWNSGTEGFDSSVVVTVNEWIDGGMKGPVPWPTSPFFTEWAAKKGWSNVDGRVGFRFTAALARIPEAPK